MSKKQRFEKKAGPQHWRRSNQDSFQKKQEGEGQDSDQEEEFGVDNIAKQSDRSKGSYCLEELKLTSEYASRVELDGPKRKYAVGFGYLGSNYQGLQINPGCKSVEKELERALFLAGAIAECNYGDLHKLQWSRAARTDKGVHAIGQCCAMKLTIPMDATGKSNLIQSVNSFLPQDIRVFAFSKVTKNFVAKIACSQRRYHYLLPTYVLMDAGHANTVLDAAKSEQGNIRDCARQGGFAEPGAMGFLGPESLAKARKEHFVPFRTSYDKLELFRSALNTFVGTHAFHNYTTGKKFSDANSRRYIREFSCSEPVLAESTGVEWVLCSVFGQSFLLNQIRKMIGAAAEVARGGTSLEQLNQTLTEGQMEVPMAPGLGLYLDELFFDQYNGKQDKEREYVETLHTKAAMAKAGIKLATSEDIRATAIAAVSAAIASTTSLLSEAATEAQSEVISDPDISTAASSLSDSNLKRKRGDDMDGEEDVGDEAHANEDDMKTQLLPEQLKTNAGPVKECSIDLNTLGEPLRWSSDRLLLTTMKAFKNDVIWPHIYAEEESSLHFMYFLDFVRVKKFCYSKKSSGKTVITVGKTGVAVTMHDGASST